MTPPLKPGAVTSASGGAERVGGGSRSFEGAAGAPVTCVACREVPKMRPKTSQRTRTGLTRGLCAKCYGRAWSKGTVNEVGLPPKSGSDMRPMWSLMHDVNGYLTIKTPHGIIAEHRHVMQVRLGRQLVAGENVHHINGVRDDNRLENLELWMSPQPYGQRVENLIQYMAEHHATAVLHAIESLSIGGAK